MSTLSLTAVAVDRYQALSVSAVGGGVTRAVVVIVMMDMSAMVAVLPYSLHMTWEQETCWEDWDGAWRQVYGVFIFTTQFTLPLLVSSLAYIMIITKLAVRGTARRQGAARGRNTVRRRMERARNRRRSGILMSILVVFVICWLPLNIINLAEDFNFNIHCWRLVEINRNVLIFSILVGTISVFAVATVLRCHPPVTTPSYIAGLTRTSRKISQFNVTFPVITGL